MRRPEISKDGQSRGRKLDPLRVDDRKVLETLDHSYGVQDLVRLHPFHLVQLNERVPAVDMLTYTPRHAQHTTHITHYIQCTNTHTNAQEQQHGVVVGRSRGNSGSSPKI